jgi:uncharacterized protein YndB with AHSA1/START domain
MSDPPDPPALQSNGYVAALVVRRIIRATPDKLFAAWTRPEQLMQWWGPEGVSCPAAEIDLRPGGRYRIANRFADGALIWISGVFEVVQAPHRLVYTWCLEAGSASIERVSIDFKPCDTGTEVVVTHERIGSAAARITHERGWSGCLDGLVRYAQGL